MSDKTMAVSESTRQVRLRTMEPADVQALFCMENDPAVWQYTAQGDAPYTRAQIEAFVCGAPRDLAEAGQLRLMIEVGGVAVGTLDLYGYDAAQCEAWVGILVWPEAHRGQGIGGAALRLLIERGLPVARFLAKVEIRNQASSELFLKAGFVAVGQEEGCVLFEYRVGERTSSN